MVVSLTALFQGKTTWYLYKRVEIELSYERNNQMLRAVSIDMIVRRHYTR